MAADNVKQYFHQWCDKQSVVPQFDVRTVGKFHKTSNIESVEIYFGDCKGSTFVLGCSSKPSSSTIFFIGWS